MDVAALLLHLEAEVTHFVGIVRSAHNIVNIRLIMYPFNIPHQMFIFPVSDIFDLRVLSGTPLYILDKIWQMVLFS